MLAALPHIPASPLPMHPSTALLQWSPSKFTSPSLSKVSGPQRKRPSQYPSTPFRKLSANSPPSSPGNSTSGLNPAASYTPTTWFDYPFVLEAVTATSCLHIMSTPMPSLSQCSNHATTGIALMPTTASCIDSNPKSTVLIYKSLTMRPAQSIVVPLLTSGTALSSLSRLMYIAAT